MKVVCIKKYFSQGLQHELTYGKIYDTLRPTFSQTELHNNWWIVNDRGHEELYSKDTFITLEEWRSMKLKELGI
jgi:hypothetical protein